MSSGSASRFTGMETEGVTASTMIEAASEVVFAVLADPSAHAAIDGPGGVREALHGDRITVVGQVCRMAMDHENHPDKNYEIASRVEVFDEPRAIAWQRGTESPETGELSFGGWIWRYALEASGPSRTPGRSSRLGQSGRAPGHSTEPCPLRCHHGRRCPRSGGALRDHGGLRRLPARLPRCRHLADRSRHRRTDPTTTRPRRQPRKYVVLEFTV